MSTNSMEGVGLGTKMLEPLARLWKWALQNFANILSVIGLFATFYLGIVYVPQYVRENNYNKITLAKQELVGEIGARFYAGHAVKISAVNDLIRAKEAYYGLDSGVLSPRTVLLLVTNDFSRNNYIPLERRVAIDSRIRSVLPLPTTAPAGELTWPADTWIEILSVALGLFAVGAGVASLRYRRARELEFESELKDVEQVDVETNLLQSSQIGSRDEALEPSYRRLLEYATLIRDAAVEAGFEVTVQPHGVFGNRNFGPDFVIRSPEGFEAFVETRAFYSKLGLNTLRGFLSYVRRMNKPGILVATSGLTIRAREALELHRAKYGSQSASHILALTKGEAVDRFRELRG